MAADKKAIDFGKIKRYIKNRTAEFYINSLTGEEKEAFQSEINYLDNVIKTKHLSEKYDMKELERIKNKLIRFAPTREQQKQINAINRTTREENSRIRKIKTCRIAEKQIVPEKTTFEKISKTFGTLKNLLEQEGGVLTSKEIEVIKKNLILLAKRTDVTLQERVKQEIQLAYQQAEEIKSRIERLNSKIKNT
jgi:hypothetical protein